MSKLTKNQKAAAEKFDSHKLYTLTEACQIVKDITFTKFDASVELSVNLGVDPRKANQMVRGVVTLPHGTGKVVRVLAPPTRRTKQRKPEPTMSDSTNTLKRSRAAGPMWT